MRTLWLAILVACGSSPPPIAPPTLPSVAPSPEVAVAAPTPTEPAPPVADRKPHDVKSPHGTRVDPYYWLRDDTRKNKDVLAYLDAENAYTKQMLAPVAILENELFAEMRARVKEDDTSVPVFDDGYWFYTRYETGKQYPIFARRRGSLEAAEEILLDGNVLAEGHAVYVIGSYDVSRDGRYVAWADDTVGRNQFTLHVKDTKTGQLLPDTATNISPGLEWAADHKTVFYIGKDPNTLREDRVFRKTLGKPAELVFEEQDRQFYVSVGRTKSRKFVTIELSSTTMTEIRLIDSSKPTNKPRVFIPRTKDHIYSIDHLDNRFVMLTNDNAKNFRVVEIAPGQETKPATWKELIPHRSSALVEEIAVYRGFLAANVRTGGLRKVQVLAGTSQAIFLDAPDAAYAMSIYDTPDPDSKVIRYAYDSMTLPTTVFETDVTGKDRKLLKQQPVPTYDPTKYTSDYLHATAKDGTRVPISIVYRKDTKPASAPLLVYGYGSYGTSTEPKFSPTRVSLLDRGWVFANAHVRGGQELGRAWYEDGRQLKKLNTFTDFIAVTEYLVAQKLGARDRVFAMGGSAGGLLMGAIVNMRPDLYRGVVAQVPFVDAVTTMLDETIPLTTNEFDEWGNPKDKAAYDYILGYSPYDNVKPQAYPSIYVKTGLWDSQVQYFEPAKWVAKLRATKRDRNLVILDTDMRSGHSGASGRFDKLRETARAYSFLLHVNERPDRR